MPCSASHCTQCHSLSKLSIQFYSLIYTIGHPDDVLLPAVPLTWNTMQLDSKHCLPDASEGGYQRTPAVSQKMVTSGTRKSVCVCVWTNPQRGPCSSRHWEKGTAAVLDTSRSPRMTYSIKSLSQEDPLHVYCWKMNRWDFLALELSNFLSVGVLKSLFVQSTKLLYFSFYFPFFFFF